MQMGQKKIRGTIIRTMRIGAKTWEEEMPAIIAARGFNNRSELMRALIREELERTIQRGSQAQPPPNPRKRNEVIKTPLIPFGELFLRK